MPSERIWYQMVLDKFDMPYEPLNGDITKPLDNKHKRMLLYKRSVKYKKAPPTQIDGIRHKGVINMSKLQNNKDKGVKPAAKRDVRKTAGKAVDKVMQGIAGIAIIALALSRLVQLAQNFSVSKEVATGVAVLILAGMLYILTGRK